MDSSISCCCSVARSPLRASSDQKPAPKSAPPARAKRSIDTPRAPASIKSKGIRALLFRPFLYLLFLEIRVLRRPGRYAFQEPDERGGEEHVERREPEKGYSDTGGQREALFDPHDPLGHPGLAPFFGRKPTQQDGEEPEETGEGQRSQEQVVRKQAAAALVADPENQDDGRRKKP